MGKGGHMKLDGQRRLLRGAVGTDAWMRRRSGSRSAEGAAGVKAGRSAHRGCAVPQLPYPVEQRAFPYNIPLACVFCDEAKYFILNSV